MELSSDKSEGDSFSIAEDHIKTSKEAKKHEEAHRIDERRTHHDQKRSMRRRVYKNLIAISLAMLFHNSSQSGLQSLQTSYNSQTLSIVSLVSSSAASSISSFFIPVIGFKLLGFKWTAIVAQFISISYVIANYFPSYYTLIPASIIHGLTDVTLMILRSSLVAALAKQYSNFSTRRPELTLIKFFAISSAISHLSIVINIEFYPNFE
jgi:cation transport ATPase